MGSAGSITQRIRQLRSVDKATQERAAQEIVRRYFQTLVILALRRLSRRIRPLVDGEDVVQSALRSFFRCEREDRFVLDGRDDLEKVLITITLNKTLKVARFHTRLKRDVKRIEQSPSHAESDAHYPTWLFEYMDRAEPTPEEISTLADQISSLPEQLRVVVELKLAGYQDKEIAEQLGLSPEAIRLRKRRIEHEWRKRSQGGDESDDR